jgi:hypothetical protein
MSRDDSMINSGRQDTVRTFSIRRRKLAESFSLGLRVIYGEFLFEGIGGCQSETGVSGLVVQSQAS